MALRRPTLLFCIMTIVLGVNYEITRPSFNQCLHDLRVGTLLDRPLLSAILEAPTFRSKKHKAGSSDSPGEDLQGVPTLPADDDEDVGKDESVDGKSCCSAVLNESQSSLGRMEIKAVMRYPVVLPEEREGQRNATAITSPPLHSLGHLPKHPEAEPTPRHLSQPTFSPPRTGIPLRSNTARTAKSLSSPPRPKNLHNAASRLLLILAADSPDSQSHPEDAFNNSLWQWKGSEDYVSTHVPSKGFNDSHTAVPAACCDQNDQENVHSNEDVRDQNGQENVHSNEDVRDQNGQENVHSNEDVRDQNGQENVHSNEDVRDQNGQENVHSNEDVMGSHHSSNERILKHYEVGCKTDATPKQKRELSLVCLCITLMFFKNEELKQRVIKPLFDTLNDTSVQKLIAEFLQWIAKLGGSKGLSYLHEPDKPTRNGPTDDKVCPLLSKGHKLRHIPQGLPRHSEGNHKCVSEEGKTGKTDPFNPSHWLTDFTHFTPRPHYITLPVRFLPSTESPSQDRMSYLGYRLASLHSLPASCDIPRTRLAEAGFYYDNSKTQRDVSNVHEVTCYSCGFSYSQWKKGDSPDLIHRQHAPNCQHLKENSSSTTTTDTTSSTLSSMSTNGSSSMAPSNASSGYGSMSGGSLGSSLSTSSDYTSSVDNAPQPSAHPQPTSAPDSRQASDAAATTPRRNQQSPALRPDSMVNSQINTDLTTDCAAIPPSVVTSATPFTNEATRTWAAARDTAPLPPSNHSSLFGPDDWSRSRAQGIDDRPPVSMTDAVYPQFSRMQDRRATFVNWPLGHLFQPDDLVMQGFYFAGYADCVRCFYCGVGLKSWSTGDDVMTEHIRWRPSCGYLLNTKGRQFVQAITQRFQGSQEQTDQANRESQGSTNTTPNSARQTAPAARDSAPTRHSPAVSASTGTSLTSGTAAPSSAANGTAASSTNLSAGLQGRNALGASSEVVRAVQDMGFSSDNIARGVRQLQQSGVTRIEVDTLLEILLQLDTDGDNTSDAAATAQNPDLQTDGAQDDASAADYAERLASENARLKERNKCKVCKRAKVGMIFLPCGHITACTECGSKMRTCSMCGGHIRATANVYI